MAYADVASTTGIRSEALTSQWTTLINLRSYHYVTAGAEDAPALLFLHGYADSWRDAEPLIPHLQNHFRIFALDQRGHGESDNDFDRFSLDDFARDVVDFIETAIGRPVTLVGHSLGSLVAQRVACQARDLVTRLVLIGSADTSGGNPALIDLKHAVAEPGGHVPNELARAFQESHRARRIVLQKVAVTLAEDDEVVAGRIRVPTLILWGDQDGVFDLYAQRRLQGLLQQSKLAVYPEIGHAPNREIPDTVARDIILFSLR